MDQEARTKLLSSTTISSLQACVDTFRGTEYGDINNDQLSKSTFSINCVKSSFKNNPQKANFDAKTVMLATIIIFVLPKEKSALKAVAKTIFLRYVAMKKHQNQLN